MRTTLSTLWSTPLAVLCLALAAGPARAHGDEDHSQDKKAKPTPGIAAVAAAAATGAASREAPTRMTDGSLFVPKPVQRQLGLRTVTTQLGELAATTTLNGRVIADPGAGGRIQATQSGTLQAAARGFPAPGMKVRKGEVVAYLQPIINSLERGAQKAQQAELAAQLGLAERRAERLAQLEGSVPAREIEAARFELQSLQQRLAAVKTSIDVAQPLTAPASGVIGAVHVVAGEVVDAKDLLFEIVDPARLSVEALAYDPALPSRLVGANGLAGTAQLKLQLTGAGLQLREQALPMLFRIVASSAPIAVGQPVEVFARMASSGQGIALPRSALSLNNAGETVVWVHSEAERFEPRSVRHRVLDAQMIAVSAGLKAGDRVVVAGATLLAQVR